tara:strand:- start:63 stop:476 length:414 start_codon:yes stop_codon:yes gene_type:complete
MVSSSDLIIILIVVKHVVCLCLLFSLSFVLTFLFSTFRSFFSFKFGPFCGKRTMLDIFRDDDAVIDALTLAEAKQAVNFWEGQDNFCPVSIAKLDSPCVDTKAHNPSANKLDCQKYTTKDERGNCRVAAKAYCDKIW